MKLSELSGMLDNKSESDKDRIIGIINHRLKDRYLKLINNADGKDKSSFLLLAISCLLIETIQCFYEGKNNTANNEGKKIFKRFFKRENNLFPEFESIDFYNNIRCGILHQAETKNGWRLNKSGPLLDKKNKVINGFKFFECMNSSIDNYLDELRSKAITEERWIKAYTKLRYICENCTKL